PPDRLRLVARGMGRARRAPLRRRGGCHPCRPQGGLQAAIRPPLPVTAPTSTPPVWEDGHALRLPPLEGAVEADVCVVGLGGSGLSAALELLARGRRVVGLDAGQVAQGAA